MIRSRVWQLGFLGVMAAALALSWSALSNPFLLDDITKIVENPDIRLLSNLPGKLLYPYHEYQVFQRNDPSRPLVYLVYTLIYSVYGLNPFGYHLFSAIIHGLTGLLVLALGRKIQSKLWDSDKLAGPLFAALIFVASPIQMGSNIYPYALSDVLATFFTFLSLWFFSRDDGERRTDRWASVFAMFLALAGKQSSIVIPALLVIYDAAFVYEDGLRATRRVWRRYLPHVGLAVAYLVFRAAYFGGIGDLESYSQAHPWLPYALSEPWILVLYVAKSLVPVGLSVDHAVYPVTLEAWRKVLGFVVWILATAGVWYALKRSGRAAWARLLFFTLAWYLVTLAPTSSVVPTVDLMVERRVYTANLGLYLLVLLPLGAFSLHASRIATGVLALYVLVISGVSVQRNTLFASAENVWRSVLEIYPQNQRALNSLANLLAARKAFGEAKEVYEKAIATYPNDYVAHGNFGALMEREDNPFHDTNRALELFKESARLNPTVAENYYNVGRILHIQGRRAEARPFYLKTLEFKPTFYPAMNNLAAIALEEGRFGEAKELLDKTLQLDPNYLPAIKNMEALNRHSVGFGGKSR